MTRIVACGDLALCGKVDRSFAEGGVSSIVSVDVLSLLRSADLFLANVECPLTDSSEPGWTHFPTLKASAHASKALAALGVGVASLANNHIADYGRKGLDDTLSALRAEGIPSVGAGWSPAQASKPLVVERNSLRIGILALAQPEISAATARRCWGAAVMRERSAVEAMKRLAGEVDIAIAYVHFGVEFFDYPTPSQRRVARALVDAGAKLVLGHHPHVPQGWEWYGGAFIAYSLGNFLFDMKPVSGTQSRLGLLVDATFDGPALQDVSVVPVETSSGFTHLLDEQKRQEADRQLKDLCDVLHDEERLNREYYYTCRGNLLLHLKAFRHYVQETGEWRRAADLVPMQFWPQILQMRVDLLRSVFSGKFIRHERNRQKLRKPSSARRPTDDAALKA